MTIAPGSMALVGVFVMLLVPGPRTIVAAGSARRLWPPHIFDATGVVPDQFALAGHGPATALLLSQFQLRFAEAIRALLASPIHVQAQKERDDYVRKTEACLETIRP